MVLLHVMIATCHIVLKSLVRKISILHYLKSHVLKTLSFTAAQVCTTEICISVSTPSMASHLATIILGTLWMLQEMLSHMGPILQLPFPSPIWRRWNSWARNESFSDKPSLIHCMPSVLLEGSMWLGVFSISRLYANKTFCAIFTLSSGKVWV